MAENQKNGDNARFSHPSGHRETDAHTQADGDIIELSEIAVGITPEDDAIVELTEDIIGEAFFGYNKATSEKKDVDENELDLSDKKHSDGLTAHPDDTYRPNLGTSTAAGSTGTMTGRTDQQDDDISRKLDQYFGVDEDILQARQPQETPVADLPEPMETMKTPPAVEPVAPGIRETFPVGDISITPARLDEAIERVIRKLYAEKINRILDAMIERTVTEEISQLKDYLIGIAQKKE